jgi:hypothetical protein
MPFEYCAKYFKLCNPHKYAYLKLDRPMQNMWNEIVDRQVRKAVNKAKRSNIMTEQGCDEESISRRFFPLYLQSMKRLGVPPHSVEYFVRCWHFLQNRMKIFWAVREGKTIAALLGFTCGIRVNIVSTASDASYWDYRPNDLLHWEFIKWAQEEGYEYFDFGSVRYEGQLRYKQKWGCTIRDHSYYLLSADGREGKTMTFDSSSWLMKNLATVWSKYVPCSLSKAIGPVIRKYLVR